jgi:hypothetical protein
MGLSKPSLSALLVCDQVIEDKATNKKSIIGAFTHIWAHSFPCSHQKMGIYFCVTDAEGSYDFTLRLVNADSDTILAEAGFSVQIVDRLSITDFGLNLPVVPFPTPGRYECQLYANKEFLGRREFCVSQVKQDKPPAGQA